MDKAIKDKVIIVTGGATGLGYEIAACFLENGTKACIIVDFDEKLGNEAVTKLNSKYNTDKAVFYHADVTKDLETVSKKIIEKYQVVDILVNNAGIMDEINIKRTIDINVTALMEWTIKFYDHMRLDRGGKGGTIINVSSIYGYRIDSFTPFYHASKFAVRAFTKSLGHANNFKSSGVRVIAICPGFTFTNLTAKPFKLRDEEKSGDLMEMLKTQAWQKADVVGKYTIEIFQKAESGSAWLIEGSRPVEEIV